jgi:hypothetical protein
VGPQGPEGPQGDAGATSLIAQTPIDPGATCPFGGVEIQSGVDTNGNGTLDSSEVESTSILCAGSQVQVTQLQVGDPTCGEGGARIDVGAIVDGSFAIEQTAFVCSGGPEDAAAAEDATQKAQDAEQKQGKDADQKMLPDGEQKSPPEGGGDDGGND